jgi:transposase
VLTLPPSVRIRLAPGATDMRKQFDGLSAVVSQVLREDPLSGHVFVFCNRRRDLVKILFWDRSGFLLLAKRLEEGRFAWPARADAPALEATVRELMCVLEGIDLASVKTRKRMQRLPPRMIEN